MSQLLTPRRQLQRETMTPDKRRSHLEDGICIHIFIAAMCLMVFACSFIAFSIAVS